MSDHLALVTTIYEAFGRGDVETILERLADDIVWDEGIRPTGLSYFRPGTGKAHVLDFFQALATTVAFDVFSPEVLCVGGDHVMVAVRERGRNLNTGEVIAEDLFVHLWRIGADGKVTSFRHIGDLSLHERAAATVSPVAQVAHG